MLGDLRPRCPVTETTAWVARGIRDARERLGWSQSELARRLGLTQTAVSYWEAGKRSPGLEELLQLADALEVEVDAFLPPERARRSVTALLRATAERLADTELGAAVDDLLLDAEQLPMPVAEFRIGAGTPPHAANELIEKAGITGPPIDIDAIARRCGVLVRYRRFPDSLSGLVFAHGEGAVIGINEGHPAPRRRFSLAHELGHFLLGHHEEGTGYEARVHIDTAEGTPPGFDWRAERAANDFAADVLMPRPLVSKAYAKTPDPRQLAARFEVSELAMGYRLVNLGLR